MDAAQSTDGATVEGIDHDRVGAWLSATVPGAVPPYTFDLIAGGRSNLTFRVTDGAGRAYALRRPPVSHVLPTAHDMAREHTVISALQGTGVPVPTTLGLCTDPEVNGAPFYVMSFVEGHIVRDDRIAGELTEAFRARASRSLIETLADLHAVDVDATGTSPASSSGGTASIPSRRWPVPPGRR
jgi:aminoglycoside phosphotransferase (APT) family kinase protein